MWVIGDKFVHCTFQQYYKEVRDSKTGESAMYAFQNVDVSDYSSSQFTSHNRSTVGRIINNLVRAFNEHNPLPFVFILDDDTL